MVASTRIGRRRWSAAGWLLALLIAFLVTPTVSYAAPPTPALAAHSSLLSSQPADGAELDAGPDKIVLVFNEDISVQFAALALTTGGRAITTSDPQVSKSTLQVTLTPPGPGSYQVSYRVVSADGHPISGSLSFRVAGGSPPAPSPGSTPSVTPGPSPSVIVNGTPTTTPSPAATTGTSGTTGSGSSEARIWMIVGGLLILLAVGVGAWERRRR